ncbi:MAG: response regulator transcription factor, partial [Lachnospiraceae bacterium]|nr:response regulator transcription factor [Lachnospiraceae bacterium]
LEQDILNGFDLGAEDYVTKPFNMKILLRRIEVAVRRNQLSEQQTMNCWSDGFLSLDFSKLTAVRRNEKIFVTSNEYKLLRVLTENAGNILTRQMLLERLWDIEDNFVDDHALTVTINRLRAKIEDDAHTYIKTVRGIGYVWTGEAV